MSFVAPCTFLRFDFVIFAPHDYFLIFQLTLIEICTFVLEKIKLDSA